jgi:uncharacterized protein YbjT (DUF2867 family)
VILVTTAGKVGAEAVRLLREQDVPVRVLVRNPGHATAGALAAAGDLDVPASIDAAMDDVSAVVLVSPAVPAQELNVVASAARAGVAHIVKATSKASADSPIARRRGQAEIETGLAATGIPHTLLRSNAYMQNVLALAPAIAATSCFGSAAGKGRTGMVDARDVAAVAAAIAAAPAPHAGQVYWLTGPEPVSNYDVAAVSPATSRPSSAAPPAPSSASPPTMPPRSPDPGKARHWHGRELVAAETLDGFFDDGGEEIDEVAVGIEGQHGAVLLGHRRGL